LKVPTNVGGGIDPDEELASTSARREIDETLERLRVGIVRETEKIDEVLSRLRRTLVAA
jgi:hypothetical protein